MQEPLKIDFSFESSSNKVHFCSEIFLDQITPVGNENHKIGKRHASKLIVPHRKFKNIKFLMEVVESSVLYGIGLTKVECY